MTRDTPVHPLRPTARVLLLDPADRILLLKGRLPGKPQGQGSWFTVGGGLEPGESFRDAAAREIQEETGFRDFELGAIVWLREGVLKIPEPTHFQEQYIVARCAGGEPARDRWTALEHDLIDEMRWWTLHALRTTTDLVFPPGLSTLLPSVLAGEYPEPPRRIPWD